jgi:phosphate transport system substrate-binding protein
MKNFFSALSALALVVTASFATACSDRAPSAGSAGGAPSTNAVIKLDGSSTVYPISEAIAEEVGKRNSSAAMKVTIGVSGTGGGLKKLCDGELDIAAASRPIVVKELEQCKAKNISFIEVPIAFDGIAIAVHPQNDWASSMTVAELKTLWAPEAQGKVMKWSDVRAGWPQEGVHLFGAGVDSGTFDYFTQAIVGKEGSSRGDFTSSEDDNVLVQGIIGDKNALGFFGLAYAHANASKLKIVGVDAGTGKGAIVASPETVFDGSYQPLARPLFVYVEKNAAERAEVRELVLAYLAHHEIVKDVGYVPLPDDVRALARARLEARTLGSVYGGHPKVGVKIGELLSGAAPGAGR